MMFKNKTIKNPNLIFTNPSGLHPYPPTPAVKNIPDWYVKTPGYLGDDGKQIFESGRSPRTIKKCIPVFDAISSGYILYTQVDVQVLKQNGETFYHWPDGDFISFHAIPQAEFHPSANKNLGNFPKFNNPYAIKTPPGYSCLFIQPLHRESNFTILPGIVDTDTYTSQVNFPFVLNDENWEGLIPAGTPMAQVIPFKRESWNHFFGSEKEIKEEQLVTQKRKSMFINSYKKHFWHRKSYN
jgi:hypothetical protein